MLNRQLVLVAIDHATDVERSMEVALSTAKARHADVHVIQVVPRRAVHFGDRTVIPSFEARDNRGLALGARLASIPRSPRHESVRVRPVTLRGEPEHVLPAYAQLYNATVLVMERDYGSPRLWRSGRVVDNLARQSPIPVLVLPKRPATDSHESAPRRILTAVDFSVASAIALRTTMNLARRHGARVTLLHTLQDVPRHAVFSGREAWEVIRQLTAQKNGVAERLRRAAAFFGAGDVDTAVSTGVVDRAILEVARRSDPDLIVMGIARRSWLDRVLFGSTLRRVLRRAMAPVLVVPVVAGAHTWPDVHLNEQLDSWVLADSAVERVAA